MKIKFSALFTAMFLTACAQNSVTVDSSQADNSTSKTSQVTLTSVSVSATTNQAVTSVINTEMNKLWDQNFDHHQAGLLKNVSDAIAFYASQHDLSSNELDKLSYYLRIYSSFGLDKDWAPGTAQSVNRALISLQSMPGFYQITPTTARLHENYSVALYRLYFLEPLQPFVKDHIKPLTKLINLYAESSLVKDNAIDYALWEVIRASAILPYEARRKNKDEHITAILGQGELQQALLDFLVSKNASLNEKSWPKEHATWALANYYNLYNKQYWNAYYKSTEEDQKKLDDDKISLPFEEQMDNLDNAVWKALSKDKSVNEEQVKTQFSIPYIVTTFRGKSECEEGTLKDRCIAPTIEQALPINHVCSDSLYILTQEMSKEQLKDSCNQLTSQESVFHEKLATNHQPAPNDFNDKLRVVIFDNAAEYNKYGQLVFDINTDNGGMYIEGTTQDPDNIATFYSYEHFWVRPEFKVWNLNHEYVHYLDGRFIKYDTFNHFPSHMVWWSEGLAEYISKGDENPKAFKLMVETKQEEWPSLVDVFNTEYKDGQDQVYKWGYLAVRYMYENHREEYRQMAHFLKTDFFDGYKKLLDKTGVAYSDSFTQWLVNHKDNFKVTSENKDPRKPRQFYRYTYKDYLQPSHLVEDENHMIWQYWHANAKK